MTRSEAAGGPARPRFVMYVPNSQLTEFHARSPWVMLPRSFQELGYESTLICASFTGDRPTGVRIVETSLGVSGPRGSGRVRSLVEPFVAVREILRQRPELVLIGPLRSSLFTFLPMAWLRRFIAWGSRPPPTRFGLKADWSVDLTGMTRWQARLSQGLLVVLDLLSGLGQPGDVLRGRTGPAAPPRPVGAGFPGAVGLPPRDR